MNLNPFAWLRDQVAASLADLEKLGTQIDAAHQSVANLKAEMEKPVTMHFEIELDKPAQFPPTAAATAVVSEPTPATPPKYVPIPVHGYAYFENTKDGFGWITKMAHETEYKCFYCDGHRKALVYRGSQKHARAWMEQFYS